MKSQERLILLGDKLIFMIKLDLTEGEVPPHPNPPPPRGEGGVGEDNQVSLLCNVRVILFNEDVIIREREWWELILLMEQSKESEDDFDPPIDWENVRF